MIVPAANASEVALSGHAAAYGAMSLREAAAQLARRAGSEPGRWCDGGLPDERLAHGNSTVSSAPAALLGDVAGQWQAKRALIIAAAGGHSLLIAFTSFPVPVSMPAGRAAL